jgi:16S rRNA processing protein RimM
VTESGAERPIVVGRVTAVFGIKGFVKVASFTDPPENLLDYRPWLLESDGRWQPVRVDSVQRHSKGFIARLDGCDDRDEAERFTGRDLAVPRSELPAAEPGEFYWFDLIGLEVVTPEGERLGRVVRIQETGANDVLVVEDREREHLIPFVEKVVPDVDLAAGRITADWDPDF